MEKVTKRMLCEELVEKGVLDSKFKDYAEKEIASMDKRAVASAKRKAEKKAADPLKAMVAGVLVEDSYMPIADILAAIGDEEVTASKVVARLKVLVTEGVAEKMDIKIDGRKGTVKGYKLCVSA